MPKSRPPSEGAFFRLTDPLGVGPGALFVGQTVRVRGIVPAKEKGAHDTSEDSVVVEWDEPGMVLGEDGMPTHGMIPRAVSLGVSGFHDMFEEV